MLNALLGTTPRLPVRARAPQAAPAPAPAAARTVLTARPPTATLPLLKGDDNTLKDAFKDPKHYLKAVEFVEAQLRPARAALVAAVAAFARADQETGTALATASKTRDDKRTEMIAPLSAALLALSAKVAELEPPVVAARSHKVDATAALERATYPNKAEVDAARDAARTELSRQEAALQRAQSGLSSAESTVSRTRDQLSRAEANLDGARSSLEITRSRLDQTRRDLDWARRQLPSTWELDSLRRQYEDASRAYQAADREFDAKNGHVATTTRELVRLQRIAQQPNPPADIQSQIANAAGNLNQARQAMEMARRDRDQADRRRDIARNAYERLKDRFEEVDRLEERVRDLERETYSWQSQITSFSSDVRSLEYQLRDAEAAVGPARETVTRAQRDVDTARQGLATWMATPYKPGEPKAIATAQTRLDQASTELARLEGVLEAGTAPLRATLAREQARYDAAMAPLEANVKAAETRRAQALAPLQLGVDNAKPPVAAGEAQMARLKAVPADKADEWKRKKKFDVVQFWVERPPV